MQTYEILFEGETYDSVDADGVKSEDGAVIFTDTAGQVVALYPLSSIVSVKVADESSDEPEETAESQEPALEAQPAGGGW
jgi:hypothetical protein